MDNEKILQGLNPAQLEAVKSLNGPVLIIAGAGSGKTKALTHRIANLIAHNVPPHNILALTFTNKAAKEMKERIAGLIGQDKAKFLWAGTFHSIFSRILRIEADKIGFNSNFSIYDTDDSTSLLRKIIANFANQSRKISVNPIRSKISGLKNQMITTKEFATKAMVADDKIVADIYRLYEFELQKSNAMDFDDLLLNMIVLLRSSKEVLHKYQNAFKYILVDEYQDTNKAQYIAVKLLASAHQNICVVGDDAQSIYRWRGADISNILEFNKDYPYSKVIRLEQNYRSTKNILKAAHGVIRNNKNQLPKKLWTENDTGELIDVLQCADEKEEAFRLSTLVQKELQKGRKLNEIVILYRTNAQSLALENSLRTHNLPYIIVGGISFYKRKEIKDVIAYITLLVNPYDNEAFTRSINEPPRGFGQTSLRHLKDYADSKGLALINACKEVDKIPEIRGKAAAAATVFAAMVNEYTNKIKEGLSANLISSYLEESGVLDMYNEIASEDSYDRLENIKQLLIDLESYIQDNPQADLTEYLQQISLVSDVDEKNLDGNNLTLMTLHTAKGLEFPVVFIAGMENGLFPLIRDRIELEEEEEERRLFYVGVTRAKEKLYLTYALRRAKFGEISSQKPSKFLREIPSDVLQTALSTGRTNSEFTGRPTQNRINYNARQERRENYSQIPPDYDESQLPPEEHQGNMSITNSPLQPGDKVHHSNFGRGIILKIEGFGQQKKATVRFDSVGTKSLMMQFAKLQRI
ncbi:MAG: UvrD-helicase domain-containing protein [Candidatus Kapaibacterium sp.]